MDTLPHPSRVLVADDSAVARELLAYILQRDPTLRVVGMASDGEEAVALARSTRPDVIVMDLYMPKLDGIEATRQIMESVPAPIIIASGLWNSSEMATTFRAVEAGALAIVEKPRGVIDSVDNGKAIALVQTVKNMAEVRVVRRWGMKHQRGARKPLRMVRRGDVSMVAVGASTGGPPVLREILSQLPANFGAPVLVVQHMTKGFVGGLVDWLSSEGCRVKVAEDGEAAVRGCAYFAPDGAHMGVDRAGRITLSEEPPENGLRPSVGRLFRSVRDSYGARAAAVLLTGMGRDGAAELKQLRETGAVTFAQDRESAAVYGMPGEAIRLDAAMHVLSAQEIAEALVELVRATGV